MQLYQYQINTLHQFDNNKNVKYICPRGTGATTLGLYYSLMQIANQKNVVFVTMNQNASNHSFELFYNMAKEILVDQIPIKPNKKQHNINIGNTSIQFLTQYQLNKLRGRTVDTFVVDNFDQFSTDNLHFLLTSAIYHTRSELKLLCTNGYTLALPNSDEGFAIRTILNRCHTVVTSKNEIIQQHPKHENTQSDMHSQTKTVLKTTLPKIMEYL